MPDIRPAHKFAALSLAAASLLAAAIFWQPAAVSAQSEPAPNTVEYYNTKVVPVFEANCYRCHGGMNHRGGLSIQTKAGMLKGGHDGSVLVPRSLTRTSPSSPPGCRQAQSCPRTQPTREKQGIGSRE
jgi:mono/diheme cytochrome c family protein